MSNWFEKLVVYVEDMFDVLCDAVNDVASFMPLVMDWFEKIVGLITVFIEAGIIQSDSIQRVVDIIEFIIDKIVVFVGEWASTGELEDAEAFMLSRAAKIDGGSLNLDVAKRVSISFTEYRNDAAKLRESVTHGMIRFGSTGIDSKEW